MHGSHRISVAAFVLFSCVARAATETVPEVKLPQLTVKGERLDRFTPQTVLLAKPLGKVRVFVERPPRWETGHVYLASGLRDRDEIIAINGLPIASLDINERNVRREYQDQWSRGKFILTIQRRVAIGKYHTFETEAIAEGIRVFEIKRKDEELRTSEMRLERSNVPNKAPEPTP